MTRASAATWGATCQARRSTICAQLVDAATTAGEITTDMDALVLMLGLGNLCIGADSPYDNVRPVLGLVIAGLRAR
jgi:hypothetical protein